MIKKQGVVLVKVNPKERSDADLREIARKIREQLRTSQSPPGSRSGS
jgi:hypothetical protein